jgi:hypothetical protein
VLDRFGTTISEEDVLEAIGGMVGDESRSLTAHVVSVLGSNGTESIGLFFNGGDDPWMLVTNVGIY